MDLAGVIARLLCYARSHLGVPETDLIFLGNALLGGFGIREPSKDFFDEKHIESLKVPDELVAELRTCLGKDLPPDEVEKKIAWAMGTITPRPSEVERTFWERYKKSPVRATDYLYDLSVFNDYIHKSRLKKNIEWTCRNGLEITINLAKPEKSNKDIASALEADRAGYPQCVLCLENVGYRGRAGFPARENLRVIPLRLDGEDWFLQYSPYSYYRRHCIVVKNVHEPMRIDRNVLSKLFAFVDLFPHFFIGSNSDLPITGGSILTHEHFQGGEHLMPLMKRPLREAIEVRHHPGLRAGIVDWYDSAVLLEGKNRKTVLDAADILLKHWLAYDNPELGILSQTGGVRHASITPILRKDDGVYKLYVILRNNRTDEEHPEGIFHAERRYHHIKKEGIGLIEAMGRFILPGRLAREIPRVENMSLNKIPMELYLKENPDLAGFREMAQALAGVAPAKIRLASRRYVADVCRKILLDTAVFKDDEKGRKAFTRFSRELKL